VSRWVSCIIQSSNVPCRTYLPQSIPLTHSTPTSVITGTSKSPSISSLTSKEGLFHSIMPIGHNSQADAPDHITTPVPPPSNRPAYNPIKDNLRTAWHSVVSLLKKASKALSGTPFQAPFTAVVVLIELGNVCPFPSLYAT
jgi:hypothetical protein